MILKYTKYSFLVLMACIMTTQLVVAQNGGFAGAASRIGFGPRGIAMADAFTATTSEGIYPYYNPAHAATQSDSKQLDLAASSLEFDRIFQTASLQFRLPPNAGLYFGIIRAGVKDFDERSLSGYPLGTFDASEYQFTTAFGINFSKKVKAGISFKLNYANYHPDLSSTTGVGIDLGLLYSVRPDLNFGFAIQDMFANYTWNSSDLYGTSQARNVVNTFPTRFKWGLALQKEKYTISTEFEVQAYVSEVTEREVFLNANSAPTIFETTNEINTSSGIFRLGGSWKTHERFTLRGGYKLMDTTSSESGSFSSGFSVHLPFDSFAPSIDYAFVIEPYGVANMHVFALRLHL